MNAPLLEKQAKLFDWFDRRDVAVAFSGGVDSATLAKALVLATNRNPYLKPTCADRPPHKKSAPTGFFAVSATTTEQEKDEARTLADEIGIELQTLESQELSDANFVANTSRRCYWCKKIRFAELRRAAEKTLNRADVRLIDGTNADDANDFRPGTEAARELGVLSPFAELGITKNEIRELAAAWGLSVAQKPSNPCLATRVAYGLPLEPETLRKIERSELAVKRCGATTCRVRVDAPNAARIEVPQDEIERFADAETRRFLVVELRRIGFDFVSLDLEGFVSGKGNRAVVPSENFIDFNAETTR